LETAGVEVDQVYYEGKTTGPLGQSSTFMTLTIQEDLRVPEFKEVKVHCFKSSTMEAHQVCARWALKEVCNQLSGRLKNTPFSILLTTVYDPSRWDTYDNAKYFEVTTEVENNNLHIANRCILAHDHALYWAYCEIVFLRWKWDGTLERKQQLEDEKQDLERRLEEAHLRNSELVQLGLAAARASSERDAVDIVTLEARLRAAEERHRVTLDTTRADREPLAEAEYLIESLGAAAVYYRERVWDLEERSRYNYYHLCHLGGRVYEEQDLTARTHTAWVRSDQRRLTELEEISALLPPKKRPRLRAETFELPPTLLPPLRQYSRGTQHTVEMGCALEDVRDYYGGPVIRLPSYPGVNSPLFYYVPPDSRLEASLEAPQCTPCLGVEF
jgi:hypothetical protein